MISKWNNIYHLPIGLHITEKGFSNDQKGDILKEYWKLEDSFREFTENTDKEPVVEKHWKNGLLKQLKIDICGLLESGVHWEEVSAYDQIFE